MTAHRVTADAPGSAAPSPPPQRPTLERMAVVKINAIEIPPGAGEELERRFAARHRAVEQMPGFLGFELLRPTAGENRYFVYTKWESEQAYQAWATSPARKAHAEQRPRPVATGTELLEFEVVQEATPQS